MDKRKPVIKNTIILTVIILTISCTGRKEPLTQNEAAALQTAAVVEGTVAQEIEQRTFVEGWQYEIENDVYEAAIHNYFSAHYPNQIIDGIQHIELNYTEYTHFLVSYIEKDIFYDKDAFSKTKIILLFVNDALRVWSDGYYEFEGGAAYDVVKNYGTEYDFIKDIPGRQLGNSAVVIGDYNNDGYDDIIIIKPAMSGFYFQMFSYDFWLSSRNGFIAPITDQIGFFARRWGEQNWLKPPREGPPVRFVTYQGMEGFILCEPLNTDNGRLVWFFYTWDDEAKKYVNKGIVDYRDVQPQWTEMGFGFVNGEQYNILNDDLRKWFSTRLGGHIDRGAAIMDDIQYVDFKIPGHASFVGSYRNPRRTMVFILDARYQEIRFRLSVSGRRHDFMNSLPGRRLRNSTVFIGDFFDDGEEKIMIISDTSRGSSISFWGYDHENKQVTNYEHEDGIWFREPEYEPAVWFVKYRGMKGFAIRTGGILDDGAEVPTIAERWVFYSWNKEAKNFNAYELENINEVEPL